MSSQTTIGYAMHNVPCSDIEGFDALAELALNLRWSWNHATDGVWRELNPKLWAITNNPWIVLLTASRDHVKRVVYVFAFLHALRSAFSPKAIHDF